MHEEEEEKKSSTKRKKQQQLIHIGGCLNWSKNRRRKERKIETEVRKGDYIEDIEFTITNTSIGNSNFRRTDYYLDE